MGDQTIGYISMAGSALALEHALLLVLLLVGLLSSQGPLRRYVPWVVLAGIGLSLLTPVHALEPAWPFISVLVLPPLLWQVGARVATIRSTFAWRTWLAWLLTALLLAAALHLGGRLPLTSALLLGVLATSLVWQVRERTTGSADLGAFGLLALALLLAEVNVTQYPLGAFLGTLFSGAGLGVLLGFIGVRVALHLPGAGFRTLFCLGLAYLAYLVGLVLGVSAVVTVAMTGLMVAVYGYNVGLWPTTAALPALFDHRGIFLPLATVWLLLGWEAHVPLTAAHLTGIGLGMVAAAVGLLVAHHLAPVPGEPAQSLPQALLRKELQVFLLLSGTLLLWPQKVALEPWLLAVALLAALLTLFILRIVLYPLFSLVGVELRLPAEPADEGQPET